MRHKFMDLLLKLGDPNEAPGGDIFLRRALVLIPNAGLSRTCLDIGCNTGASTLTVAEHLQSSTITGVDVDERMIELARRYIKGTAEEERIEFEVADAQELPYSNESYDVVVSSGSLAFIEDPQRAVMEAARIMRPGGFLVAVEFYYRGDVPTDLAEDVSEILGFDVSRYTPKFWENVFAENSGLGIEGVEQAQPFVYSDELREAQAQRALDRLDADEAEELRRYYLTFAKNARHLTIGTFFLRKRGDLASLSGERPACN